LVNGLNSKLKKEKNNRLSRAAGPLGEDKFSLVLKACGKKKNKQRGEKREE